MLKELIKKDMYTYMKNKEKEKLSIVRLIITEINNQEIDKKRELSDEEIQSIVKKLVVRNDESLEHATKANRPEEILKLNLETEVLKGYLPKQYTDGEATRAIYDALKEANITEKKELGKAMKLSCDLLKNKYDGKKIKDIVNSLLI